MRNILFFICLTAVGWAQIGGYFHLESPDSVVAGGTVSVVVKSELPAPQGGLELTVTGQNFQVPNIVVVPAGERRVAFNATAVVLPTEADAVEGTVTVADHKTSKTLSIRIVPPDL